MRVRPRLLVAGFGFFCLQTASAAAAVPMLAHKTTYNLVLDGSKPTGQLEDMHGQIDYQITGDACAGYTTDTRQFSERRGGDDDPMNQVVTSKAWEDGQGRSYKFDSVTESSVDGNSEVEATVTRESDDKLRVVVTKPKDDTLYLNGKVLMPTEHVVHVLAAGARGEHVLQAKVYDGATDPARVYETLTVIGRPGTDPAQAPEPARATLSGHTYYPVTVSYYEQDTKEDAPAYVMSFSLYDNGVIGNLKIDYGKFALLGTMSSFETLKASEGCAK